MEGTLKILKIKWKELFGGIFRIKSSNKQGICLVWKIFLHQRKYEFFTKLREITDGNFHQTFHRTVH